MKYCPNCGKKIKNNVKFCPYCGVKQKSPNIPINYISFVLNIALGIIFLINIYVIHQSNIGNIGYNFGLKFDSILMYITIGYCLIMFVFNCYLFWKSHRNHQSLICHICSIIGCLIGTAGWVNEYSDILGLIFIVVGSIGIFNKIYNR